MCGIAGILRFDEQPFDRGRLEAMRAHLKHRGPDGDGVRIDGRCALVHTRLSIIDLLGGDQPMHIPQRGTLGPLTLVFNGEIYNHRALRAQLLELGHNFVSDHCDTEVLLHGFRAWGTELPKRLHGMFALAIWDSASRRLFLCRDRTGKKPLYLRRATGGRGEVMFASLVATLCMAGGDGHGRAPAINRAALATYLTLGYTDQHALVEGIEELPAAHWATFDADGAMQLHRYWQPPPISRSSTSLGTMEATLEVLGEAVHKRLEADVPLGCMLSGGIDSSLIAALAQRELGRRGSEPLRTFNVAMPEADYDESPHALAVARHLQTRHTRLATVPGDIIADLERLIAVGGEPTADSSILPTYWLSRAMRQHVKVALSGDGGDELFGGYDRYRALALLARHRWWLARVPVHALVKPSPRHPHALRTRLHRLAGSAAAAHADRQYLHMVRLFSHRQLRMLAPDLAGEIEPALPDWPDERDPVHAAMRWDLTHYLPFDLLRKVDRASMAVALEVRCPMLDTQVCDLAGHLPASVLMPRGRQKGLLRRVAAQFLPGSIIDRPKRGFAVPVGRWFTGPLRQTLTDHLLGDDLAQLGLSRSLIETWLQEHTIGRVDHAHRLFALLTLAIWARWLKHPAPPPVGL
ncbi:MAG: asparagine synthase (glutamine-hydrolyzing) [Phycisphaeraceae bacterium]